MPIDAEDPDALVPEPRAEPEEPAESPFVTIWEAPRETIRRVVATGPRRWVNALFFASGLVGVLMSWPRLLTLLERVEIEVPLVLVPVIAILFGSITILTGHLNAWYKRWVGALLGGDASRAAVVVVSAYASIPSTVGYALVLAIQLALFGAEPFSQAHPTMDAASPLLMRTLSLAAFASSVWAVCLSIVGFAEVNRFTVARSIATSLLAGLFIVVTIAAMMIAAAIVFPLLLEGNSLQ
jgi:Yip1-like protein